MTETKCPACSHVNDGTARFCGSCGIELPAGTGAVDRLVGQVVGGRYRITRVIAEGGMGIVYAAEQKMGTHLREVAVKTLLPELSRDPTTVSRFYRECGTVAQLEHPNTIRFYDFGEAPDGSLYIAMEYVRGDSLSRAIETQGALGIDRIVGIVEQISGALHEAHELGIVHRDLKPDNILLTERAGQPDFVKLLDFGIAARVNAGTSYETKLTQQGMVLGTPPYMSPEQFAGGGIDRRSDIYSLGIIVYEMAQGKLPFEADTPWQWAHQHMAVMPPELGAHVPAHFRLALARALAKQSAERPATVLEFFGYLSGRVNVDRAPTAPDGAGPPGFQTTPMLAVRVSTEIGERTQQVPAGPPTAIALPAAHPVHVPTTTRRRRRGWGVPVAIGSLLLTGGALGAGFWWQAQGSSSSQDPPAQPSSPNAAPVVELAPLEVPPQTQTPPETPAPTPPPQTPRPPRPANPQPSSPATAIPTATATAAETSPGSALPPPFTLPTGWPPLQIPGLPLPGTTAAPPSTNPPTPPAGQPTTPSGGVSAAACAEAKAAASRGDIEQAASDYRTCQQQGASSAELASTRAVIASRARTAVRQRAFNNDCNGAASAVSAAESIGAGAGARAEYGKRCPQ